MEDRRFHFVVTDADQGLRLDRFLSEQPSLDCSRSYVKQLINDGHVGLSSSRSLRPSLRLELGEEVSVTLPAPVSMEVEPEDIPLDVVFEDAHLIVVNKPVGMVVHPAPGHYTGTLVHALLFHCQDLSGIGGVMRPGIVHRLDRDTSGVMVAAKTDEAHQGLSHLFKHRPEGQIERVYAALARGNFREDQGTICTPFGRHPSKRQQYSSLFPADREAITHFQVEERFGLATLLSVRLQTGRTHQIRVHMADRQRGLIGDPLYGGRAPSQWPLFLRHFPRQALHARSLSFVHPVTQEWIACEADYPEDMGTLLARLRLFATAQA